MDNRINANSFTPSSEFYESEFEKILTGITACYKMMLMDNIKLPNNENKIRDILRKDYLNNREIKDILGFTGKYHFDREVPEDNDIGRVDIRIITENILTEPKAYYTIECKRLDNKKLTRKSCLNAKYVTEGIKRFIDIKYSTYYSINGMIGFVVEQMDIYANIKNINKWLNDNFLDENPVPCLKHLNFIEDFEYQYYSIHKDIKNKEIKLYHLMFDFSANIIEEKASS
ncbi:MAG: hypothetical protein A7316_10340 [Candidatus Altiarchaeales archaeon WOR_SM1_86-2]|nr:MAG: hypothetical protein A7316_10340 [Candidatus Altiarchaeales archaeon WOR_SM1_86-2]ODS37999.1 MAG: hypothetical protein A7315_12950 [Candidatus Altiarchaeales archaeon WOR_SM1_79]